MSGKKLAIALALVWTPFVYAPSLNTAAYGLFPALAMTASVLLGLGHFVALRIKTGAA